MRENEVALHEYHNEKYTDAMMLAGFPSVGLVSSIAANFIIRSSKLERVAGITADSFPPFALVHEGRPSPPVRIYAGDRQCKDGERCQQIVAVAGEFMPRPELIQPLASRLLDYCEEKGIRTIVTMEGINWPGSEEPKVFGVGSTDASREMLKRYDVEEMQEGMISGLSGVLLYGGEIRNIDVICLLAPARSNFPDARGSAKLLEVIARMLPEIRIDPGPLYKEAEEIEKQIRKAMEAVEQPKKPTIEESIVYG